METISQSPPTPSVEAAYPDFVRKLYNRTGDLSKDFAHAILGIVTEIHEFMTATDEVNALEELGDLLFYNQALEQVLTEFDPGLSINQAPEETVVLAARTLADQFSAGDSAKQVIDRECKKLLDHAKRWVGYGKAPSSAIQVLIDTTVLIGFVESFSLYELDIDRALKANMKKLLKRYPAGEFDAFHAVVRDLEAERAVLQAA